MSNPPGRFETRGLAPLDDAPEVDQQGGPLATTLIPETARTIITRNDSPDIPFDRSVNPYRGCEHGCIYCFARPTHEYLGFSAGLDFETKIIFKPDAPRLLEQELRKPAYRCAVIAMGSNTDPYQPAERRLGLTRRILQVLSRHDHPVSVVTKSTLVLRDLDILRPMARKNLASVMISVTTIAPAMARCLEPRAPAPRKRLETIRRLSREGIPAGVLVSPMIPGLNDPELESILRACAASGARCAGYQLLRLPGEVQRLFCAWLAHHYPLRAKRVLSLLRQCRAGTLDDPRYGSRMSGQGPYARLLGQRFELARRRCHLEDRGVSLDTTKFRASPGEPRQGVLFG